MITTKSFILSGRYQILERLGQGSDAAVYLARHQSLAIDRAIKIFPKYSAPSNFAISEASVLKTIQHPGIPTIYDLEEDEDNYYLVEEYIQGESLEQFLLHQQSISRNLFFKFCEQLCDIFLYLHTRCPKPIVYQDLKPEHLFVCGLQLKLIDFSVSSFLHTSGTDIQLFGNQAFSAPELASGSPVLPACDIYSIGKIMEFMIPYVDPALPQNILTIIQKATNKEPHLRYETVGELSLAIQHANDNTSGMHLRQTIAVIGAHPGCGATHIAVSLVCILNALGRSAIYYEKNTTDRLRKAVPYMHHVWEDEGCYISGYFKGYPRYGEGIQIQEQASDIAVFDYGCDVSSDFGSADLILYVCGGALWHRSSDRIPDLPENLKKRLRIIANLCDRPSAIHYARQFNTPVYQYPYDTDPFGADGGKQRFADWLSYEKGRKGLFLRLKNLISRLPGR